MSTVSNFLLKKLALFILLIGLALIGWPLFTSFSNNIGGLVLSNHPSKTPPANVPSRPPISPPVTQLTPQKEKNVVWVEGKPLEECLGPDKVLNENVIRCRSGYYKEIAAR